MYVIVFVCDGTADSEDGSAGEAECSSVPALLAESLPSLPVASGLLPAASQGQWIVL